MTLFKEKLDLEEAYDWFEVNPKDYIDNYFETKKIPQYDCCGDALWDLVENLYQSGNAIDTETIDRSMVYLCHRLGIDIDSLSSGLQVVHWKDKVSLHKVTRHIASMLNKSADQMEKTNHQPETSND